MKKRVFFYKDELNDEFSGITRKTILVDKNYTYLRESFLYKIAAFFVYRIVVVPFAFFYVKAKFRMKVKNREVQSITPLW